MYFRFSCPLVKLAALAPFKNQYLDLAAPFNMLCKKHSSIQNDKMDFSFPFMKSG